MAKAAKKYRNKRQVFNQGVSQINRAQAPVSTIYKPVNIAQSKILSLSYDANAYIKKDLKWTLITTLIIVAILIILYIFFH